MAKASSAAAKTVRKDYEAVKRVYKAAGKKAFGKPKSSAAYKDYKTVKAEYKRVGSKLGKLTGRKPRK